MIGHALNSNNDIFLDPDGSIAMVSDGPQVVQHVRSRLQLFLGEWFLDIQAGTPWYENILIKPVDLGTVESILKTRILETPEVVAITAFNMDYNSANRTLLIKFNAETIYGSIDNTEVTINA